MDRVKALDDVVAAWTQTLRPAIRRSLLALGLTCMTCALLIGRLGTTYARVAAAAMLVLLPALASALVLWVQRRHRNVELAALRIVARLDRTVSSALERALALLARTRDENPQRMSIELAELHLQRTIARIPSSKLAELAARRARLLRLVSNAVLMGLSAVVLSSGSRLFEGMNVLLARNQIGPWTVQLLELEPVSVEPPLYLRSGPNIIDFDNEAAAAEGSLVVVRGTPTRARLPLVLTGQEREIPFVSDGKGGVAARTVLSHSTRLGIAARFGGVLLKQREQLVLRAIPDPPPAVTLEDAPRRLTLDDVSLIDLRYHVTDDHGIRQVDLVLRSATREDRRLLVRLDGETKSHSGAYSLAVSDAFITGSYGPIELRIVARDGNNLEHSTAGQSEPITLERPAIGRAQTRQREIYVVLRNQLLDWLAAMRTQARGAPLLVELRNKALDGLASVEPEARARLGVRGAMRAFLRAQRDKLLRAERHAQAELAVLDEVCLSVDSAIETIARLDAEQVSILLADVALEIESAAKAAAAGELREDEQVRLTSARTTLLAGARELKRLSVLGGDLGEVAIAGYHRIEHACSANDYANAARAASFLAERLRRPRPSFVGGGRPGTESQRGGQGRGNGHKASEADLHLERVALELRQLARDHATEIESVERLLNDTDRGPGSSALGAEAKRHADELRRLVEKLPSLGAEPGSMQADLALAKELTHGAAESMTRAEYAGAFEDLQKADRALKEADLLRDEVFRDHADFGQAALQELRRRLAEHREWLKQPLEQSRQSAERLLREPLRQSATREQELAERALRLAMREAQRDAVLPDDVRADLEQASRLMQNAVDLLQLGRGELALQRQRSAQDLLDRGTPANDSSSNPSGKKTNENERSARSSEASDKGRVVSTSDVELREEFRRKVQKGLSYEIAPELSPAVRRYAEGLLK